MRRNASPIPEWMPSASSSGSRSYGIDCQTRSVSPSRSATRWKIPGAPSQPSLSWIATTPRLAAMRRPSRVASTNSSSRRHREPGAELPRGLLAQNAGRLARGIALDDAALDLEIALGARERGGVEPCGVVVLREEERGDVAGHRVERGGRRLLVPLGRAPAVAADPASVPGVRANALERLGEPADPFELHLALRQRPGREVDVRVREAGEYAAAAEVDDVGARQRRFVGADAARDVCAGDGERACRRERRIHRADRRRSRGSCAATVTREGERVLAHVAVNVTDLEAAQELLRRRTGTARIPRRVRGAGSARIPRGRARARLRDRPARARRWGARGVRVRRSRDGRSRSTKPRSRPAASTTARPGLRPQYDANYYAAYVLDLDGNNIEAVCHHAPT